MNSNDGLLRVGDVLRIYYGPFAATVEVTEIKPNGAVVRVNNDATLVGYSHTQVAPDGVQLTIGKNFDWIGKAHWHSQEKVTA